MIEEQQPSNANVLREQLEDAQLDTVCGGFTPDGRQLVVAIKGGPTANTKTGNNGLVGIDFRP